MYFVFYYIRIAKIINNSQIRVYFVYFFTKKMIIDYFIEQIMENFGHKPTEQQENVIFSLAKFVLSSKSGLFILKGYAGTGKTSIVSALVKTMKKLDRKCELMAPTGRAAKVLASYAGEMAYTIHKRIYKYDLTTINEQKPCLDFKKAQNTLFIVDEASMISNEGLSGGFYGTGCLLDDLMQYVFEGDGCKMILLGDTAQLPPVGENESPALLQEFMSGYGIETESFTLTQVVRQKHQSGILLNATNLRENCTFGEFPDIVFGKDVIDVSGEELIEEISSCYDNDGIEDTAIVCRSNKRANIYNNGIRGRILDREEELEPGDLLMIAKNNYYWLQRNFTKPPTSFLANGDTAIVKRVRHEREFYGFRFADCELTLPDYDDVTFDATVLLDTLQAEAPSLTNEQSERLFLNILEDYKDIPNKKERFKKLYEDPYFNALQIKYAYAVTCHKAQGGQWKNVFIDQGYVTEDMLNTDYFRWLYTAITRATKKVFLVNWSRNQNK